ncbi:hypothetical protein WMF18_23625 [Sorangium sp. So ce315]|uniref:hypothetical protein n=1 Tax=Sorangium sp. So ce315 TaxID=3133299 RepID=UPI003F64358A
MNERSGIALWAGVECTVNRVGDRYFDQIARTGHQRRLPRPTLPEAVEHYVEHRVDAVLAAL